MFRALIKFQLITTLIIFSFLSETSRANALKVSPSAFEISLENVLSTELSIEKSDNSSYFKLNDPEGGRVLNVRSYGIFEDSASNQKTPISLESTTDKLTLCVNIADRQTCFQYVNIPGVSNRPVEIIPKFSEKALKVEKLILFAYQNEKTPAQLDEILDEKGFADYKKYSHLILSGEKQVIDEFQLLGEINSKKFTISGSIYYRPNVLTISQERERDEKNTKNVTIIDSVSKMSSILSLIFLTISLILMAVKLTKKTKTSWLTIMAIFSASVLFYFITFTLRFFIGVEIL